MPQRMILSGQDIPSYVKAPSVTRLIRYLITLTSAAPVYSLRYSDLSGQDGNNYLGTPTNRYSQMRVIQVKAYAESPNSLSVSQRPYGIILTDTFTSFSVEDRAVTGSRVAAVGLKFPFYVRSLMLPCSSTTIICTIASDTTIAASTDFLVVVDTLVEFSC